MLPVACAGRSSLLHEQQKGAAFQMACSSSLRHEASSEPRLGMTRILAIVVRAQVGLLRAVGNGLLFFFFDKDANPPLRRDTDHYTRP